MINLHHQPESIRLALADQHPGVEIRYSYEEEILGTSGALDRVRDWLPDGDFVVMNGKVVTDIDLSAAIEAHTKTSAIATLVLRPNAARERFSNVTVNSDGRIAHFDGFPAPDHDNTPLMFTGIQVLSPRILDYVPRNRFSHSTTDVYPCAIEAGEVVMGHVASGDWFEMSTLDRYLAASIAFMRKDNVQYIRGKGCDVSADARIDDSVLWDHVRVSRGARLHRVIIGDSVRIAEGFEGENLVIVRREDVRHVERGQVVGDNVIVPILKTD
jgi:NDP-sugar pyrophosphorylase family protein